MPEPMMGNQVGSDFVVEVLPDRSKSGQAPPYRRRIDLVEQNINPLNLSPRRPHGSITRPVVLFIMQIATVLSLGLPALAQANVSANTCASPASSSSLADPFTTTFAVTVRPGDTVLSVVDGYRAAGKTILSVVFNGQNLTKSAGTLGNTMGAEIWSLKNPTATTANVVITYTSGGTFVFEIGRASCRESVYLSVQSSATFTTANASTGISLTGLTSTSDKDIF